MDFVIFTFFVFLASGPGGWPFIKIVEGSNVTFLDTGRIYADQTTVHVHLSLDLREIFDSTIWTIVSFILANAKHSILVVKI